MSRREGNTAAVVVATRDRAERLVRLLEALARQWGAPPFEVVIVDDGSLDDTVEQAEDAAKRLGLDVLVLRQENSTGPAGARNRGWRASDAPIVAFIDDDCVPAPDWLAHLVGSLDDDDVAIAAGVTTYPADQAHLRATWSYWMEDDGETGQYSACNVAYRRPALDAVGGFDEEGFRHRAHAKRPLRCVNGEDTDLAWRTIEVGFRSTVAHEAIVHHDVSPSNWRAHFWNVRRFEGLVLLFKKHPHLRKRFGKNIAYRTTDVAALAVLAGLTGLAVRRARVPAAVATVVSAAWYTRLFRRYYPPPAGQGGYLVAVPLGFVADAHAALVMVRASIRHRTLLL